MGDTLPNGLKVNLGCGPVQPSGWVNVDGSNRAWVASRFSWLDRLLTGIGVLSPTEFGPQTTIHNLFKPLPFGSNTVACIYAGELWEHFEYPDAIRLTGECFRTLVPGGVLRVCVPDGVAIWSKYLDLFNQEMANPENQRSAQLLKEHVAMYFKDICTRNRFLKSMGHTHKWQYDEIQLIDLFKSQGFVSVARMPYHQSRLTDIQAVERSNFLIVEGVKPGVD